MITTIAFILQITAAVIQIFYLYKKNLRDKFSYYLLLISGVLLIVNILIRSIEIKFIAITNTFESLVFFSSIIMIILFIYSVKYKSLKVPKVVFGSTMVSILFLAIAASPIAPKEVLEPIPVLKSNWLFLHVTFAFIGEAFFVVGFISALLYVISKNDEKKITYDKITYTSIFIGYPIYSIGALVFGAIWASNAWGRFWSWDPKETWALITWLTYSLYLHLRLKKVVKEKTGAWIAILGFVFTMFTFFGVNYLLPGLHSYR